MNVQSRLFDFISSKKISISDFERACGLSNGYVHKIKNSVGKRGLLDIQRKFPELNTDWLLTGEGEMLNDTSSYIVNSDHHGTSVAGNGNNVNTHQRSGKGIGKSDGTAKTYSESARAGGQVAVFNGKDD